MLFIAVSSTVKVSACDICGCGVGSNYVGILPEFSKHIFGSRYRFNSLVSHIGAGGAATYLTSTERYRTAEMWSGWNVGKKTRVMLTVPYAFNERENGGVSNTKNGLGDITVTGFYQLLNKKQNVLRNKLLIQSLWLGAGIKLPSGKYIPTDKMAASQNTNLFQLGTASTDFSLNTMYDARLQDAGINISASYKMNTANRYHYNYGNKLSLSSQLYYKVRVLKQYSVAPNAGVMYEKSKTDIDNKMAVDISGGNLLSGTAGIEVAGKKIAAGFNWQTPLSQNLANGTVKSNNRLMMHFAFIL